MPQAFCEEFIVKLAFYAANKELNSLNAAFYCKLKYIQVGRVQVHTLASFRRGQAHMKL